MSSLLPPEYFLYLHQEEDGNHIAKKIVNIRERPVSVSPAVAALEAVVIKSDGEIEQYLLNVSSILTSHLYAQGQLCPSYLLKIVATGIAHTLAKILSKSGNSFSEQLEEYEADPNLRRFSVLDKYLKQRYHESLLALLESSQLDTSVDCIFKLPPSNPDRN